jgi:hypothetical protein
VARKYAQIKLAIWGDDDFRELSPQAQHLFFVVITSPTMNHCGVADWRPGRIAAMASGWTVDDINTAAAELVDRLYLVIDEETEEVLVRSFIRHDELMRQPKMAVAVAKAHDSVASSVIRGVVVHELNRLRADEPGLNGWEGKGVAELLGKASIDPSTYPLAKGSRKDFGKGSVKGFGKGIATPSGKGSTKGCPTPAPAPAPEHQHLNDSLRSSSPPSISITAQTITAGWVDASKANGAEPSKSQIGQVGKLAKELLGKNDPARVLAAAKAAGGKGYASIDRELTVMAGRIQPGGLPAHTNRDPTTGRLVER